MSGYDSATTAPASTSSFPVIAFQGYTYFPFSDTNNDFSYYLAKYDSQYNFISITGFGGDRYIAYETVNSGNQTETLYGQSSSVTIGWSTLTSL